MRALTRVVPREVAAAERTYPYLGVTGHGEHELIIYFTAPKTGMCVSAGPKAGWNIGAHHDCWAEKQFQTFYGKIEIEQTL